MLPMDHARKLDIATDSARKFVQMGSSQRVVNLLRKFRAVDAVTILSKLGTQERLAAWKALHGSEPRFAADVVTEMSDQMATAVLSELEPREVALLLRSLPIDDAAHLVGLLPDELIADLREDEDAERTISPELAGQLAYGEKTAGRIMTPNVLALPETLTVGEAIRALQERSDQFEMVFYLYVIDERRRLVGVVSLRQLLLNASPIPLRRIMVEDVVSVRPDADQEEVAQTIARYNFLAIPVVDSDNRLVGLITVDDAIDVLREEATEDLYALAGVATEENLTGTSRRAIRLRLPWLYVNLATASASATVVHLFEGTIQEMVALASLMPIVAGLGGNAGTQTLTVVVRGLALGELAGTSEMKVLLKEAFVGLGNGLGVGIVSAVVASIYFRNPFLGIVLCVAMLANVMVATIMGTVVPFALRALRLDPATGSSVFVTACTDMTGFAAFLGLATLFIAYLK
jgi:magnesium transporter